jgi:hypothetical protein
VEDVKKHEAMQFHAGWNAALDQLIAMVNARAPKKVAKTTPAKASRRRGKAKRSPRAKR